MVSYWVVNLYVTANKKTAVFFTADFHSFEGGAMGPELKESGEHIKQINAELEALGPTLVGLTSQGVYHTNPVPEGCEPVPSDLWLRTETTELVLGDFTEAGGRRHALVANRSIERARWALLRTQADIAIEVLDRESGEWAALTSRAVSGAAVSEIILPPGDGVLLRRAPR